VLAGARLSELVPPERRSDGPVLLATGGARSFVVPALARAIADSAERH
jgi:hypothetical protein